MLLVAGLLVCLVVAVGAVEARNWPSLALALGALAYGI